MSHKSVTDSSVREQLSQAARPALIMTKLLPNTICAMIVIVALPGLATLGETHLLFEQLTHRGAGARPLPLLYNRQQKADGVKQDWTNHSPAYPTGRPT
ncbi:MAG: hypothetical protein P8Z00_13570 [Anaerolineales bacterium]